MQMNPYLPFDGRCKEAFAFYEKCLDGKVEAMHTWGGSPMAEHAPEGWDDAIMHAQLVFGDNVLMGSDVTPDRYEAPKGTYISLNVKDPSEADRLFETLAEGGTVTMPIDETFWAARFGMLVDRFGIPWMVNCEKPS